jgi:hypothetical protein
MTQSEREESHVERAERTHKLVMEQMAKEQPGMNQYTWRDRYLTLFQRLWDHRQQQPPEH